MKKAAMGKHMRNQLVGFKQATVIRIKRHPVRKIPGTVKNHLCYKNKRIDNDEI